MTDPLMIERGPDERYVVYGQRGGVLHELASTPTPEGVGVALIQLHKDAKEAGRRLADEGMIGVRDSLLNEWIILPFTRAS